VAARPAGRRVIADAQTTNLYLTKPEVGASADTWGTKQNADLDPLDAMLGGLIYGLTLSTAVRPAPSVSRPAPRPAWSLASAYTKTTSSWAVGTAMAGALDTGSIANSTWYHVWLIERVDTGVVDVLVSLSATAPTMPTNYTRKRRIGAMKTMGPRIGFQFVQLGDEFLWGATVYDATNASLGDALSHLITLTVPTGVQTTALYWFNVAYNSTVDYVISTSPDQTDTAPTSSVRDFFVSTNALFVWFTKSQRTNTSAQVRLRAAQSGGGSPTLTYSYSTYGWIDPRGRY
jgi:hypothetical protein